MFDLFLKLCFVSCENIYFSFVLKTHLGKKGITAKKKKKHLQIQNGDEYKPPIKKKTSYFYLVTQMYIYDNC